MFGSQPSGIEIGSAAMTASAVAGAPTILPGPLVVMGFPIALLIAGAHMLLLGIPAYLLLRRHIRIDWAQAIGAGFVIGMVPVTVWQVASWGVAGLAYANVGILAGGCGALAGATFRGMLGPPADPTPADETASVFE